MLVVLELAEDDVARIAALVDELPSPPLRVEIVVEGTVRAHRVRRLMDWWPTPPR